MSKRVTQGHRVVQYMLTHGSITRLQAMNEIGVANLTAVISDLRADKFSIETIEIKSVNRYGEKITYAKYVLRDFPKKSKKYDIKELS